MQGLTVPDILAGVPLGAVDDTARLADSTRRTIDTWTALEDAMVPAMRHFPLVVGFSGGRDSSLILAAAASAARRHSLPDPVAVTLRFPNVPSTDETHWQEAVIGHIGIADWRIVTLDTELDFLGPVATANLLTNGLRYPPNAHLVTAVGTAVGDGAVVLGLGGDELFAQWRWRRRRAALGSANRRDRLLAAGTIALGRAPHLWRRRLFQARVRHRLRTEEEGYDWLTPAGCEAVVEGLTDAEDQPLDWSDFVTWSARRRALVETVATCERLAGANGLQFAAPFLDAAVLDALGGAWERRGWASRTHAMVDIAGDRLPSQLLSRRSKASFTSVYWGSESQNFAEHWDGSGVDPELVNVENLRRQWCSARPDFRSGLLLHHAWLQSRAL